MTDICRAFRVLAFEKNHQVEYRQENGVDVITVGGMTAILPDGVTPGTVEQVCALLDCQCEIRSAGMVNGEVLWDSFWWPKKKLFSCRRACDPLSQKNEAYEAVIPSIVRELYPETWEMVAR